MKKIPVEHAVGHTICHDMTKVGADGFKGVLFKRGHVITEEDVEKLKDIGKYNIFVWEEGADEVHEEDAAIALANAVAGGNITFTSPSEGKVTLISETSGLFRVKKDVLYEMNMVPDVTIACLPSNFSVKTGDKLAGVRIIPLVTKRDNLTRAVSIAQTSQFVFEVLPFKKLSAGIIITGSEVYYGRIKDRFEPVIREKLGVFGASSPDIVKCPDDLDAIKSAISDFKNKNTDILILTGGMSVDPDDYTPTAIRESGAAVITYGTPAQPGNMLMFAYLDGMAMFGVPGAAMHNKITSLDVFLPRVFAGIILKKQDFASLGEGGFCRNCPNCTYPSCYFGRA